jgi:predicted unusual protein kinase regulating ubiquinone biosynthesis (AarF/ABC1/UbiB family)
MNKRIVLLAAVCVAAAIGRRSVRGRRNLDVAALGMQVGGTYASTAARKLFASAERRVELDRERELRTAEAIADRLGNMKGALMKLGQMASYVDEGLPEPMRAALAELQSNAPPMS